MKAVTLFTLLALIPLPACNLQPGSDPQEEIVRQLSIRRIVMLGDFAHEFPLSSRSLIATLDAWLSMLEKGESGERHLALFLEENGRTAERLSHYLATGDLSPLLEHLLPLTSVERLEFYADLRTVCMRMEEMNLRLPDAGRISLEIVGPEALSIFDPGAVDLSARESRLYFVRERDSLAAGTIVSFLRRHPEKKALIFYGNGHLIKNRVRKDHSGVLDGEEAMGFYLGRHLKAAFGDSAVFTIGQIGRARSRLDLDAFGGRDAFLRSGDAPWGTPPAGDDDTDPGNFDAFIVRDGFMVQAHSLRHAASGRILDAALALRAFATPHRAGAMGNRLYLQSTNTLAFFAETTWTTTEEWSAWIAGNRAAALARMHSGAMRQEYAARGARLLGTREFGTVIDELIDLGFDPRAGSPRMGHAEWDSLVTAQWPQILLLNAIAVLWVGDAQEQATARDYLARTTGENFAAPAEYLKWWRKRFYGVAY